MSVLHDFDETDYVVILVFTFSLNYYNKDTNTVKTQQNLLYSTTSGLHVSTP